jgi:hypothetical protein
VTRDVAPLNAPQEATATQDDREQRIRNVAYRIWVEEGFPKNQDERHWRMAQYVVAQDDAERAAKASVSSADTEKLPAQRILRDRQEKRSAPTAFVTESRHPEEFVVAAEEGHRFAFHVANDPEGRRILSSDVQVTEQPYARTSARLLLRGAFLFAQGEARKDGLID